MNKKKSKAAQQLGRLGGLARAKKYSKSEFSKWGKMGGRPRGSKNKYKLYLAYSTMENFLKLDKKRIQIKYPYVTDDMYDKYLFSFHVQYGCGVTPRGTVLYPWTKSQFKRFIMDKESEWRKNKK